MSKVEGTAIETTAVTRTEANIDRTDSDTVFSVNPLIGLEFNYNKDLNARFEIEGFFHSKAKDKGYDFKSNGAFVNYFVDLKVHPVFVPYAGFGLGVAHNNFAGKVKNQFAWHAGAGVSFITTDNLTFDIGARYAQYGKYSDHVYEEDDGSNYDLDFESKLSSIDFLAGVRYAF